MSDSSGGQLMEEKSGSSVAPLPQPPSSPSPSSRTATPINVLAWANFAAIVYVWTRTPLLLGISPLWPLGAIVLNALPGGTLGDVLKTAAIALVNKIPGRESK